MLGSYAAMKSHRQCKLRINELIVLLRELTWNAQLAAVTTHDSVYIRSY